MKRVIVRQKFYKINSKKQLIHKNFTTEGVILRGANNNQSESENKT